MNNFGRICFMHETGLLRVEPYYEKNSIQVYLEPGLDIDTVIAAMEQKFRVLSPSVNDAVRSLARRSQDRYKCETGQGGGGAGCGAEEAEKLTALISMYGVDSAQYALMVDGEVVLSGDTNDYEIDRIENNRRLFVTNVDSIADSTRMMAALIITGTVLLVVLVLYMVIKSMLTRRRGEFGIYKGSGLHGQTADGTDRHKFSAGIHWRNVCWFRGGMSVGESHGGAPCLSGWEFQR